jgi:DNA replication and repair protein RecF
MRLSHLSLTNFRNFTRLDIDVPGGLVLLVGSNAQGKTSLLEAVYFLATFDSYQANSDRQLINFVAARDNIVVARIQAELQEKLQVSKSRNSHQIEIRIIQEKANSGSTFRVRKEILLDGIKKRASETIGIFNAVLFLPQMLRVIEGSPEDRRRYLNIAISQVLPSYVEILREYKRILSQRNALLKQLGDRGGDEDQLSFWDEKLSIEGAKLILERIRASLEIEQIAQKVHSELTREAEIMRMEYVPSFDPVKETNDQFPLPLDAPVIRSGFTYENIQNRFFNALSSNHKIEIERGMTTIGPHRDDLRFISNGIDLGEYGSRGQCRTAVLASKLAEVDWIHQRSGDWPVLLLDEVISELDPIRKSDLLSYIQSSDQALITTADQNQFTDDFIELAQVWHIVGGLIRND